MDRLELLRGTYLFVGCSEDELRHLCGIAEDRRFSQGEVVFSQGDEARDLLVVASGSIQLELPVSIFGESKHIAFETAKCGDVVAWSSLVPPYECTLSGRAGDTADVVALPRDKLADLFDRNPEFGLRITRKIASIIALRLSHTRAMWAQEIQRSLDERYR